jgi:regulator of RNase E activity RraA
MTSTLETLRKVTTGTITTMLLKKGIRRSWMADAMPFGFSGKRVVGKAFTLRFVPVREDLATPESWTKPISTRSAIEAMPENCVVVAVFSATSYACAWSSAASRRSSPTA